MFRSRTRSAEPHAAAWRVGTAALFAAALSAAAPVAPATALPVLSEVLYDAVGSDNGLSFVELYGAPGTPLAGLRIEGVNGADGGVGPVVELVGSLGADGFFVLADDAGDGSTLVGDADQIANFDLQNGPDSVVLLAESGVLDAVGYGVFAPGDVFAGEGAPAPDATAGSSLARHFSNVDTQDNAADFGVSALPTPGSGALLPVPEPSSAALLALGLGLLAPARRGSVRPQH